MCLLIWIPIPYPFYFHLNSETAPPPALPRKGVISQPFFAAAQRRRVELGSLLEFLHGALLIHSGLHLVSSQGRAEGLMIVGTPGFIVI